MIRQISPPPAGGIPASVPTPSPYKATEYCFEINTKTRIFILRARTYGDMCAWIRELNKHTVMESENRILDELNEWIEENEYETR